MKSFPSVSMTQNGCILTAFSTYLKHFVCPNISVCRCLCIVNVARLAFSVRLGLSACRSSGLSGLKVHQRVIFLCFVK